MSSSNIYSIIIFDPSIIFSVNPKKELVLMKSDDHKFLVKEIDFFKQVNNEGSKIKVKYKEFDQIERENGAFADQLIDGIKKINVRTNLEDKIKDIDRDIDLLARLFLDMEDNVAALEYLHEQKENDDYR